MDTKEKQQQQPQKATKSLFDGGLYSNVHPLHDSNSFRRQSPSLPSSDSCATSMSQTSESRRNSNEGLDKEEENEESGLCSVFDKLNTEEFEERRNSSPGGKAEDDFVKPYHRSMSVDVGSMQRKLPLSASSSCSTRHGAGSLGDGAGSNNIHDLLSRSLLFDNKSDLPSFPATPQAPRNDPYLRRYAGSTEKLSSLANKDKGYNGIFPSSSALDLPSSLRRNSARHNKSVESLRSESWAQYLENAEGTFAAPVSADDSLPDARAQAAFIGQQRRFSYNWPDMGNGKYNHLPANMKFKNGNNRLTTSHSYSDLHDAALRSYYAGSAQQQQQQHMTAGSMHDAMLAAAAAADNLEIPCPQYQQHGFCVMDNHCPYSHNAALSQPALMDHNAAAAAAAATTGGLPPPHPLGLPALPFYSSLYQQYAMLNNLTPNASPAFSMKAAAAVAALLNANLAPGQRLPTDIRPNNNNNNSGSNNSSRRTSQATTPVPPNEEPNRFAGARLEEFRGKIYDLCKDQNGCRFLQKKLEEPNRQQLELIFEEVQPHFVELMTEPFGNYLCQKLIEHCDDAQRDILVDTVAPDLLKISLNMHGTRAVQRFIEFLSTPQQIHAVTVALKPNVVTLIKDLNGNHVIQKCLHRLSAEHKQFIYDAVSEHCIQVATHRHGCCVLQRCIDYASDAQKDQLVKVITWHALPLVQDPFGNYVVQYVLDLGDIHYTDTLVRCFLEHVCDLSVQKFSSNVIEKCIRVAEPETRRLLVAELMNEANIEKLLRDSFANYVIQTCLEYADQDQRLELVEAIRPLLPSIRSTPCGKRIHSKIQREQPQRAQQQQQQQQQQMQHPPRLRQQQSLGSLRLSNNAGAFGNTSSSSMYSNGTNSLAFGLPLIGNNTFYPYP